MDRTRFPSKLPAPIRGAMTKGLCHVICEPWICVHYLDSWDRWDRLVGELSYYGLYGVKIFYIALAGLRLQEYVGLLLKHRITELEWQCILCSILDMIPQ